MNHYTVQDIMALGPCQPTEYYPDAGYPEWRVRDLFGGRRSVTLLNICDDEKVPIEDRQWVLHRLLPEPLVHEAACRYAEHALERERAAGRDPDPRSWAAIAAKRAWLRGEVSDAELVAAWDAAIDVCWDAADKPRAARATALSAARAAADRPAYWVSGDSAAAWAAAATDAIAAERWWQLDTLRAMIVEYCDGGDRNLAHQRKGER